MDTCIKKSLDSDWLIHSSCRIICDTPQAECNWRAILTSLRIINGKCVIMYYYDYGCTLSPTCLSLYIKNCLSWANISY